MDAKFSVMLEQIFLPDVKVLYRAITSGDEKKLLPDEFINPHKFLLRARQSSGAGRDLARDLLQLFGLNRLAIPRLSSGAPSWPYGFVGSIAHDDEYAIVALASRTRMKGIGVDIERSKPLPPEYSSLISAPGDEPIISSDPLYSLLFFVIKEAVYKALNPLDGIFLEPQEISIDLNKKNATVSYGRVVNFDYLIGSHIIAFAYIREG
ncbi:4'-phosphopantetheinyl transferase superfamily protein [Polynucleobacter sp. MG-28-Ekke-A2]|uniref:4'-phosphopantetheinyl transferase family protein n=1 Tax=Polynucleobacter sp. MG-28-Ekke-A2 TaxID=3108276 RepID=UPI002B22A0C2|nr:4'-phosphopantetheinyl transferase superfamily protein [Polynucleobacter sp. MG-28-Ekke-A2]MEA9601524.1 4'-phosphopantetheinyl transferase superfamily protein [Polynucleobacter sp. MG-28-Ekke-A2]